MRKRNSKGQFVKKTKNSETSFIQLNTYTSPIVQEVDGEAWISYGENNDHFQFLIDRFNGSPTNSACINGVSQQIYGKGLNATDSNRKPNEYAQMVSLFKKDIVRKLCYDLKLMGQCAIQVIYSKDRSVIAEIEHMPIETLRAAKCDEDGNIPAYYYFNDWANITQADEPLRIPAWGMSNSDIEILYIKPYKSGFYYYSPVDYQGGLQYAELEEEISNFHLSNVLNGLTPGLLLNFNNGVPNQQERKLIESRIAAKFQGSSNSGRMIVSFNDNKESQAEITPVQLSDAHNQYDFLSSECTTKVMLAHRIVSPKLLGINNGSGFGNNAEEITQASILMDNTIIRPFQELLIENFDKILAYNNISLNLYFTTLQPLEFTEIDKDLQDKETIEEETGVELSKVGLKTIDGKQAYDTKEEAIKVATEQGCGGYHEHEVEGVIYYMPCVSHEEFKAPCWDGYEQIGTKIKDGKEVPNCVPLKKELKKDERDFLTDEMGEAILDALKYEPMGDDYELVATRVHSDENTSTEDWANSLIKEKKSSFKKFADFIKSKPNGESKLDKSYYKIRYSYQEKVSSTNSREFCKQMMARTGKGVVYRKEDIDLASEQGVNSQFGHKGRKYSLFAFKGGIYCGHYFQEELYRMKTKTEKYISKGEEVNSIPNSYQPKGKEYQDSKIAPIDMKDRGAYPN